MVNVLHVAEKNDAAKGIANILSGGRSRLREGFSKYNKIYEFNGTFNNRNVTHSVTSVSGHLLNYAFDDQFRSWERISPLVLFDIESCPVRKSCTKDMENIKRTLEREARNCFALVIWTDCDREGENIGFEVRDTCLRINPRLIVYRATFSEITQQSINRAIQNLGQLNQNVTDAVDCRQELDLRIGAAFTRFQTLRLRRFPQLKDKLISYGSCQFPTLGFVVERYLDVVNFVPEPFWKLRVLHTKDIDKTEFAWQRNRLFDESACRVLHDLCMENFMATVKNVVTKPKQKWRPKPLDTVEFEKMACRKLRLTAKEAMTIAERLYSRGFISYPRTETNIFPDSLNLHSLVQKQTADHRWGQFAANILQSGPRPSAGKKSDQAHPPIHPTAHTTTLSGSDAVVYEFIVRHFLACVSDDARGLETTVHIDVAGETFHASGLIITETNYLDIYPYDKWSDKSIGMYQVGEQFKPDSVDMLSSKTSPPNLLSEADLIALMDTNGIGTDATHAEHIQTIQDRLYVRLDAHGFIPGYLGLGLVEGYNLMGYEMSKPNLRRELEEGLKAVCEGRLRRDNVLREQITKYRDIFAKAMEKVDCLDNALGRYFGPNGPPPVRPPHASGGGSRGRRGDDDGDSDSGDDSPPSGGFGEAGGANDSDTDMTPARQNGKVSHAKNKKTSKPPVASSRTRKTNTKTVSASSLNSVNESMLPPPEQNENDLLIPCGDANCFSCPKCRAPMKLQIRMKNRRYLLTCDNVSCKEVIELSAGLLKADILDTVCDYALCPTSSQLVEFSFKPEHFPFAVPSSYTACISCDADARSWLGIDDAIQNIQAASAVRVLTTTQPRQSANAKSSISKKKSAASARKKLIDNDSSQLATPSVRPPLTTGRPASWGTGVVNRSFIADGASNESSANTTVKCDCGLETKLLTVRKGGANQGRQFYSCANFSAPSKCQFFKWADESTSSFQRNTAQTSFGTTSHHAPVFGAANNTAKPPGKFKKQSGCKKRKPRTASKKRTRGASSDGMYFA